MATRTRFREGSPARSACERMLQAPCVYCGGPGGTLDHVVPKARGGYNAISNLVPCCAACNQAKGNLPLEEFLAVA